MTATLSSTSAAEGCVEAGDDLYTCETIAVLGSDGEVTGYIGYGEETAVSDDCCSEWCVP